MPTPTITKTVDSSALYNLGHVWLNPENPVTIDSTAGLTPVFTVNMTTLPAVLSSNPLIFKYRLTNVTLSIDRNYDGVNLNQRHTMNLMFQTSNNGTDWTDQRPGNITAIENGTGRFSFPMNSQSYAQVSASVFPYNDGTHTQATVLMGLDGDVIPSPAR